MVELAKQELLKDAHDELAYCQANLDAASESGDFGDECYWSDRLIDAQVEVAKLQAL